MSISQLALYSVELYKALTRDLGQGIEYEEKGSLLLIENQDELRIMEGTSRSRTPWASTPASSARTRPCAFSPA